MANENCLQGMRCPRCGSEEPFIIKISTLMRFFDDGSDTHGDVEWDASSPCTCEACGFTRWVNDFRQGAKP